MSKKVCIFTGHRVIPREHLAPLQNLLDRGVAWAYEQGYTVFLCGGAMGFDRMAADAVLRARVLHPDIHLGIIMPCRDQDSKWSDAEKSAYKKQLDAADSVEVLREHYVAGCMQARNRVLVQRGDVCIAYAKRAGSGSGQTMEMARKRGIPIYNLANEL